MASQAVFALALVGLCLASCTGVQGSIFTAEDGVKVVRNLKSHANNILQERPYIIPKALRGANATNISPQAQTSIIKHWALYETTKQNGNLYGTKASINVYGLPNLNGNQTSMSGIWLFNGEGDQLNVIQAGWIVSPSLYGDTQTHFFTFWTADNCRQTCCFDLRCKGFVVTNDRGLSPGRVINPISTVGGNQYDLVLSVYKEAVSGDWWLILHLNYREQIKIGYWPKSLFTSLVDYARVLQWGGFVGYSDGEDRPPMGTGKFVEGGLRQSAYIANISYVSPWYKLVPPTDKDKQAAYVDDLDCYTVGRFDLNRGNLPYPVYSFYYGGPNCGV